MRSDPELAASQERLEAMLENDRERAATRLAVHGLSSLSDYERNVLLKWDPRLVAARQQQRSREKAAEELADRRRWATAVLRPNEIVFRSILLQQLNEHAIELVVKHAINVRRNHDTGGRAFSETRTIHVPPVTNEDTYTTLLHECGHVLSTDADSQQFRYVVAKVNGHDSMVSPDGEIGACSWAAANAITWTRGMQDHIFGTLLFYSKFATSDERERMVTFVQSAAMKVKGLPWTFGELAEKCALLRGEAPALPAAMPATAERITGDPEVLRLKARLEHLEARPTVGVNYCGVYRDGSVYSVGDLATRNGALWLATASTKGAPGTAGAGGWKLIVKEGRA